MQTRFLRAISLASLMIFLGSLPGGAVAEQQSQTSEPAQELTPPRQIEMYLDGFHNYRTESKLPKDKQSQIRVAHYCSHFSDDLIQCVLYDGNTKHARLIGMEYVIPDKVYQSLPASEKKYWHPHNGEVDSGMLVMPGLSEEKQKQILSFVGTTHGKTWHAWNPTKDRLPFGEAKLMWPVEPDQMKADTKKMLEARKANPAF